MRKSEFFARVKKVAGLVALCMLAGALPAYASSVSSASFGGGAGTVSVGGTLYAKQGGALTLTVNTSSDTRCVEVSGAHTATQSSASAKSSWTFSFTAGSGDGVRTVTATARPNQNCGGMPGSQQTGYVLDNTGPQVTGSLSPAPNGAGWNNTNVSITWSADDAGSGVGSGPTPATDSVTANNAGVTKTSTASDRLGNSGSGSVTIKLDKMPPTVTGARTPVANAHGWNNTNVTVSFTCSDSLSGIKSCTGGATVSAEGANQSVAGTAVDNADNDAQTSVNVSIDKTAPSLSGAPTSSPNAAGWYKQNVTIAWTCADVLSGIDGSCPTNSTISGEGEGLTASTSVKDKAGNQTNATSAPVRIDKTAPLTTAEAPEDWNNVDQTVALNASDALSGVDKTYYKINDGPQTVYAPDNKPEFSAEGVHTLEFWSIDTAGNEEAHKTVQVKIDRTPPTISHQLTPPTNVNGWNNSNVTVTFICNDTGSGIKSCTPDQTITTEGANQPVTGTAEDNAGNTATDPAKVSIDKTPPTISAARDREPNGHGWYNGDVIVSFTCADALSGIDNCPASKTVGEGSSQSVSGTARDAADNEASATESGINVDKTSPELSGAATTSPNGHGWYSGDFTVAWSCSDALSGIDGSCPANSTIPGEGDNLSAGASVNDKAGNSTTKTVSGFKIDRTAPSTSASVPAPLASGWYAGAVEVTLTGVDHLSGVDKTYYSVDGGSAQEYDGPFSHALPGSHTITFWSLDKAGNVEDSDAPGHTITIKIDNIKPTITGSRAPEANAFGWNNGPVTVSFVCDDLESGIAGCVGGTTLANEGAGQEATGVAQDNAGNVNSTTVSGINIDLTAPTLTGAPTAQANAGGWYKDDVTIKWTAQDGLSGVDDSTVPGDAVITGEGASLGAGPVDVYDKAGNIGQGSVAGIKIDRTAPTITGQTVNDNGTPRNANADGWFNSAVRVRFNCSDPLSGIASCAQDVILDGDGTGQSAIGDAADQAGNTNATTVSGVNIDSVAPQSNADIVCEGKNGWCKGNKATIGISAEDQLGLSGIKQIRHSVNGGPWQSTNGDIAMVDVPLAAKSGTATVQFYAVDKAGNSETVNGVSLKYDNLAPTVSHTLTPPANAAGWNSSNVLVHFDAEDDSDGSGVDPDSVTPDVLVQNETSGLAVSGEAYDFAGNKGTDSVTVKLDKTAPSISGAPTTSPNANGWYNGPVTVKFTCGDSLSGIAACPADETLTANGAELSVTGTAIDKAGNQASFTVGGLNIDSVKPDVTVDGVANGGIYTLGDVPNATCSASDAGSGLDGGCNVSVTGGLANGVGEFTYTATAKDKAGNVQTVTGKYKVKYRWDGYLQPISDTTHQVSPGVSVFKAGSTVPAKFKLKKADGSAVQANSLPQWLTPVKGSLMTAPVDETVYTDPATSGSTYKWDATDQQYIYNWGTPKNTSGNYWRIGVVLDDGSTYYVNIGLR